jgi:hypothetical protein
VWGEGGNTTPKVTAYIFRPHACGERQMCEVFAAGPQFQTPRVWGEAT